MNNESLLLEHPFIKMHKICFLDEKIQDKLLKEKLNFSFPQYIIMVFCHLKPGISQEDIAKKRNCTEASISRITNLLIKNGFVIKKSGKSDKRKNELYLTEKGKNLLKNAQHTVKREFDIFLEGLNDKEIGQFNKVLEKIFLKTMKRADKLSIIKNIK